MTGKYEPLEKYLRGLPSIQEDVTLTFTFIEQMLNESLPASAREGHEWWGNQRQGTQVESIAWMEAGWLAGRYCRSPGEVGPLCEAISFRQQPVGMKRPVVDSEYCRSGDVFMEQGIFFEAGEGIAFSARGSSMLFKAVAETTGGAFSLMERELPVSNRRPQPHTHPGPEGFYVLQGSIEFVVGDQSRVGGPGFWALVSGGVSHTFGNVGESPARLLIIHVPAADAYFAELQALWGKTNPPTPGQERALMRRHGLEPVESEPSG